MMIIPYPTPPGYGRLRLSDDGRLRLDDLAQISEFNVGIIAEIGESFGMPTSSVKRAVSDLRIKARYEASRLVLELLPPGDEALDEVVGDVGPFTLRKAG